MFSKPKNESLSSSSSNAGSSLPTTVPSKKQSGSNNEVPSIIASDLKIVGNLISGGAIEIEGDIQGNVSCLEVTIRRSGKVKGDVISETIQIDGEINGLVKGKHVNVSETGKVTGVVIYESLAIKDGAHIDGQCKSSDKLHKGEVEAINDNDGYEFSDTSGSVTVIDDASSSEDSKKAAAH